MFHFTYEVVDSSRSLETLLKSAKVCRKVGFDFETSGLDPFVDYPLLLQLGVTHEKGHQHVYVMPAIKMDSKSIEIFKEILEDPEILVMGHNLAFDWKYAYHHYGIELNNIYDSFITESCLTLGLDLPGGLGYVSERRLGIPMNKRIRNRFIGRPRNTAFNAEELEYSAKDVAILPDLRRLQLEEVKDYDLKHTVWLENQVVPITAELEYNGVLINRDKWGQLTKANEQKALELLDRLEKVLNMDIPVQHGLFDDLPGEVQELDAKTVIVKKAKKMNVNSPPAVKEMLEALGVKMDDTSSATMGKFKDFHPAVKPLMEWRELSKLLGSFFWPIDKLENSVTHRWHPQYKQMPLMSYSKSGKASWQGTTTGRYSSSNFNFQQMPQNADMRSCFIAKPGHSIITADYSSMEVRIAANLSGDEALIEFFNGGFTDFHGFSAARIFDMPLDQVSKIMVDGVEVSPPRNDLRNIAKTSTFAIIYGQQVAGLAMSLGIKHKDAQKIMDKYYEGFPGLMQFLDRTAQETWRSGYIRDPAGRIKFFDNSNPRLETKVGRQAKNFPVQATNASQTKYALLQLRKRFTRTELALYATVHDEIVAEIDIPMTEILDKDGHPMPSREAEERGEEMKNIMIKSADKVFSGPVPYDVSYHIAGNWLK